MIVKAIKTHKITPDDHDVLKILARYVLRLSEGSIVAITSKIISICEGRFVPVESSDKDDLVKRESDFYLPKESNKYNLYLAIKNNLLAVSAGIDESNSDGNYVLWPKDPQASANKIRAYLAKRFKLKKIGVIITDSKTTPLRFGVTGAAIAHSGFSALNDLIGTKDIFGRTLKMTKVSVLDGLAASAVLLMGEGSEQTPLAIISDIPFVRFQERNPTGKELSELKIDIGDDVYAPILKAAKWKKGK
jgi:putative folate metabolism gamma-glutamate ligase